MTFRPATDLRGLWTPEGERLIFASFRSGVSNIFSKPIRGGMVTQHTSTEDHVPTSLSSDGATVIFRRWGESSTYDIGMVRLDDDTSEPEMLLATAFDEHTGVLSPDDRWLAYVSNESGRDEVYVRTFPDMEGKEQISIDGGVEPMWARDGTELFYRSRDRLMAVAVSPGGDFGKPVSLFEGPYALSSSRSPWTYYDVAQDGKRFVMLQDTTEVVTEIRLILDWGEELERLAPSE